MINLTEGTYLKANIDRITDFNFPPGWLSFSLIDSIHSFYPRASVQVKDKSGDLYETLATVPGIKWMGVEYGRKGGDSVGDPSLNFVVNQENFVRNEENPHTYSGIIDFQMLHEWSSQQETATGTYKGALSKVVSDMVSFYSFSRTNIETTSNTGTWYQGNKTKARFIQEVAIPIAYSSTSSETPYFAFIDLKNQFHFRSFGNMLQERPSQELYVSPSTNQIGMRVISISSWGESYTSYLKHDNTKVVALDSSGSVNNIDIATSNSIPVTRGVNLVANKTDTSVTSYPQFLWGTTQGPNERGKALFQTRDTLFQDRHLVVIPFEPTIFSGHTIKMTAVHRTGGGTTSTRVSGVYLVEMSEHLWDGETVTPVTKLLLCRKNAEGVDRSTPVGRKMV